MAVQFVCVICGHAKCSTCTMQLAPALNKLCLVQEYFLWRLCFLQKEEDCGFGTKNEYESKAAVGENGVGWARNMISYPRSFQS